MAFERNLDILKKNVLIKAGITSLTPSDCKRLSFLISRSVNKNVSETTLKRFFGFASVKHNFSRFTITALCEFIGKDSWEKFNDEVSGSAETEIFDKWDEFKSKALFITKSTIKSIRNRSGIPFEYTVPREFAERDFDEFYNGNQIFLSFIAQPGSGKSILLAHLLEKTFLSKDAVHSEDIVLFVTPGTLSSLDFFNIDGWLNEQFGGGKSLIEYYKEQPDKLKGKILLVLDGFDDVLIRKETKNHLNHFTDFICALEGISFIKLIFSVRNITWVNFYENIRHSAFLKSNWFSGNYFTNNDFSNVPPLTDKEILKVLENLPNVNEKAVTPKLRSQFKFPFYIHIYYQLRQENENFDCKTELCFYELINAFIHQKINLSPHYTEKVLLLKKIILLSQKNNYIFKEDLLSDIITFKQAYEELLLDGILVEEKHIDSVLPKESIRFIHQHVFEYFLFIEIFEINQRQINSNIFNYISSEYKDSSMKSQLFQWAVIHAVANYDVQAIIDVMNLHLPEDEKNHLVLFIVEMIEYKSLFKKNLYHKIVDERLHETFLQFLLRFDILGPCYKEILKVLKRLTIQPDIRVIYNTLLAYIAVQELDIQQLETEIADLRNTDYHKEKWLFRPEEVFDAILGKLTNKDEGDLEVLNQIKKFKYQPSEFQHLNKELSAPLLVSYIMAFAVNFFYGTIEENALIYNSIKGLHPHILLRRNSLSLFLLNFCALIGSRIYKEFKSEKLMRLLQEATKRKKAVYPEHFNLLFLFIKLEYHLSNLDFVNAKKYAEKCLSICEFKGIGLLYVSVLNSLVFIYKNLKDNEQEQEVLYKMHCFLDKKNISSHHIIPVKNYKSNLSIFN